MQDGKCGCRRLQGREQEKIRIGFNTGIADRFLSKAAQVVSAQPGKFRLEVATSTNRRIQRLVYQDKLDIGFLLSADMDVWSQKLSTVTAIDSDMVLIVPPSHALSESQGALSLEQIAAHPMVVSETELGSGRAVMAPFKKAGMEPNVVADCDNVESIKAIVASGLASRSYPISASRVTAKVVRGWLAGAGAKTLHRAPKRPTSSQAAPGRMAIAKAQRQAAGRTAQRGDLL